MPTLRSTDFGQERRQDIRDDVGGNSTRHERKHEMRLLRVNVPACRRVVPLRVDCNRMGFRPCLDLIRGRIIAEHASDSPQQPRTWW